MAMPQILAATFTIAFEGLMMFQNDGNGGRKHVAIVDATTEFHKNPRITICHKGPLNNYPLTECGTPVPLKPGDEVSFGTPGSATPSKEYLLGNVPNIKDYIVAGAVHQNVIDKKPVNGVLAFIELSPGELTIWRTFEDPVLLSMLHGAQVKCFTRYVILKATTTSTPAEMKIRNGGSEGNSGIILDDGDLVYVSNTSTDEDHQHFPSYKHLLKQPGGELGDSEVLHNMTCKPIDVAGHVSAVIGIALDAHTKSQDHKNPHGDCGPIDNP